MKKNLLLCGALAALLLPADNWAQNAGPAPDRPERPNVERLREELRDLPPEERRARLRELRDQNAPRQGGPEERPFAGRPGMQAPAAGAGVGANRLMMVLTPEQRQSLRTANEENREQMRELQEQLREARKAVAEASFAGEFNEAALRKKLDSAAKLDTELAILRARALSQIDPPLSAEQIEKIKNPPPPEMLRDRQPGVRQPLPGERPRRNDLPPGDRPVRRGPADAQRPPPGQF